MKDSFHCLVHIEGVQVAVGDRLKLVSVTVVKQYVGCDQQTVQNLTEDRDVLTSWDERFFVLHSE